MIEFNEIIEECLSRKDFYNADRMKRIYLEYRKINNIFEKGDHVLRNDGFWNVLKVVDINTDSAHLIRRVDGEPRWSRFKLSEIRHATDLEIAAGHRL